MSKPTVHPPTYGETLENSVDEILAGARPLPFGDEMIIEGLTEEEQRDYLTTALGNYVLFHTR
ncbi:hypothetical protein [Phytoactinopolyspora endophytica]|uniref:hypothetical protein n=1 Tax=Phytoactinopolyspora endophytica TaxID=1642495 RepID=UPI00101DFAFC|nr:hypothetical protein [Phytoactinopolyspora endophytica]